jgi:integrase
LSKQIGIEHFGAHDLRRTCAKLCRKNGGDLEQIKFLLGHSSIQTTERYLGSDQEIAVAVNDNLGLRCWRQVDLEIVDVDLDDSQGSEVAIASRYSQIANP